MATAKQSFSEGTSVQLGGSPESSELRRPSSLRGLDHASSLKALLLQQLKQHVGFGTHDSQAADNLSEGGETSDSDCSTGHPSIGRMHHSNSNRSERRRLAFRSPMQLSAPLDADIVHNSCQARDIVIPLLSIRSDLTALTTAAGMLDPSQAWQCSNLWRWFTAFQALIVLHLDIVSGRRGSVARAGRASLLLHGSRA